jgi:hypothetical protein
MGHAMNARRLTNERDETGDPSRRQIMLGIRAGTATPAVGIEAGEPTEFGRKYTITPVDVMVFDEPVIHTAYNRNSEPAVLMGAQLWASDRPLTEFTPELATPVA